MILEINKKKAGIDEDVFTEAKRLLLFSLSRFEGVITRTKVRFFDVNGPKGGIDKRCSISVKLRTPGQILVSGQGSNYIEALSNCIERLVRSTRRATEKHRHFPFRLKRINHLHNDDQNEIEFSGRSR